MTKYPLNKFILDHSEDYPEGMTLIMRIRENKNRTSESWDCHVLMWEVEYNEKWSMIEASSSGINIQPISGLTKEQKRMSIESLFIWGIRDETK